MGYYTVLTPCVVGKLHYASIPAQPIKADDAAAADLIASGALVPYPKPAPAPPVEAAPESPVDDKPRRRRAAAKD